MGSGMPIYGTVLGCRGRLAVLLGVFARHVALVGLNVGAVASSDVVLLACCVRGWSRREIWPPECRTGSPWHRLVQWLTRVARHPQGSMLQLQTPYYSKTEFVDCIARNPQIHNRLARRSSIVCYPFAFSAELFGIPATNSASSISPVPAP